MLKRFCFAIFAIVALACSALALAQAAGDQESARPLYYTRAITNDDLEGRTLRDLSLMRNTIYARAGNKFRKQWLNDYFSALSWYHPLDKMDESKLTVLDKRNAEIIADYDAALPASEPHSPTMPASSRFFSASSETFGMSRVISSGPSLVSRAIASNSSMWIEVKT